MGHVSIASMSEAQEARWGCAEQQHVAHLPLPGVAGSAWALDTLQYPFPGILKLLSNAPPWQAAQKWCFGGVVLNFLCGWVKAEGRENAGELVSPSVSNWTVL